MIRVLETYCDGFVEVITGVILRLLLSLRLYMKWIPVLLIISLAFCANGQKSDSGSIAAIHVSADGLHPGERMNDIFTIGCGVGDYNKIHPDFSYSSTSIKQNISGFVPLFVRYEHGLNQHATLAFSAMYDALDYNFEQATSYQQHTYVRNKVNHLNLFGVGLDYCYYLNRYIDVKNLDPFVSVGVALYNIHEDGVPSGDSTFSKNSHPGSICLKAGVRYTISAADNISVFAAIGYDRLAILDLGVSCKLYKGGGKQKVKAKLPKPAPESGN